MAETQRHRELKRVGSSVAQGAGVSAVGMEVQDSTVDLEPMSPVGPIERLVQESPHKPAAF